MAEIAYFAESSCWNGDNFRQKRQQITFRVFSIGKIQGQRIDHVFSADYGLYYDPSDEYVQSVLSHELPTIDWDKTVFVKDPNHSQIGIIDIESGDTVASIVVRRRLGGDPSGEIDQTNVSSMEEFRLAREKKNL